MTQESIGNTEYGKLSSEQLQCLARVGIDASLELSGSSLGSLFQKGLPFFSRLDYDARYVWETSPKNITIAYSRTNILIPASDGLCYRDQLGILEQYNAWLQSEVPGVIAYIPNIATLAEILLFGEQHSGDFVQIKNNQKVIRSSTITDQNGIVVTSGSYSRGLTINEWRDIAIEGVCIAPVIANANLFTGS